MPTTTSVSHFTRNLLTTALCCVLIGFMLGCGSSSSGDSHNTRSLQTSNNASGSTDDSTDDNTNNDTGNEANPDITQSVSIARGQLHSPLTSRFPDLPNECHNVQFLHYTPVLDTNNQPYERQTQDADTVFFFMPGLLAGAGAFNYLAEQLILEAYEQQQQVIEVLVLDRRDQCLRDMAGLEAAEQQKDVQVAIDYYYNQDTINGRQFEGIKSSDDLPWLSEMGLALVQQDLMATIAHLVPDPQQRQQKVFVGGHSLGGLLTHSFAGWDFDGDINTISDAGFNQAAGFIRLDIDVTPEDADLDEHLIYGQEGFIVNTQDKANQQYQRDINRLVEGKSSRIMEMPGLNTETFFLLEMLAMQADWAPEEEATLVKTLPIGDTTNLLLQLVHSRSYPDFFKGNTNIRDFRYTNQALLGAIFDDDFMPVGILQTSLGFLANGDVKTKSFPLNPTVNAIIDFLVPDVGNLLTKEQLYIAVESGIDGTTPPLYTWVNFEDIRNNLHLNTSEEEEVTDISLFAKSIYKGPGTFAEWYMSSRVGLELEAISNATPIQGLDYWHAKAARSKPLLEIVGDKGLAVVDESIPPLGTLIVAKGYNHVDLLSASNHHKSRRENAVITPILSFAQQHKGHP